MTTRETRTGVMRESSKSWSTERESLSLDFAEVAITFRIARVCGYFIKLKAAELTDWSMSVVAGKRAGSC